MKEFDLTGKTALVTGAGRGIGAACVLKLVAAGADVIAVARTQSDLDELASQSGGKVTSWCNDVTDSAFIERIKTLQKLDILVNNAGTNKPEPIVEVEEETLDRMLHLNVRSCFLVAQAATEVMLKSGGGSIINMSSQMGHIGSPNRTVYCMTKHAIEGLTKAMAVELAPENIRVNTVAPTFIKTDLTKGMLDDEDFSAFVNRMIPLGKVGIPDDVATAVLYLASDSANMITGHSLRVDGGWTAQ